MKLEAPIETVNQVLICGAENRTLQTGKHTGKVYFKE